MSVELVPARAEHVSELGRIAYEAFKDISDRHGFPTDFGSAAYDFSANTLIFLSQRLARNQRLDPALAMARLNVEFHPQASQVQTNLGEVLRMRGDTAGAVAAYRQALQLNAQDGGARQRLRELGQQP